MALQLHRVFPDSYQYQTFYVCKLTEQFIKLNNFPNYKHFKVSKPYNTCKFRLVCKQSLFHNALFKPNCFVPSVVLWDLFIRVEKAKICKLNFAEQDSNQSLNSVGALRKVYLATHTPRSLGPVSLI